MKIRSFSESDIPLLARVQLAAWQKAFRDILSDKLLDSLTIDDFVGGWEKVSQIADRTNLVIEDDQGVFGFVSFGPAPDEDGFEEYIEICAIHVHPEKWRRGAGAALMNEALTQIKRSGGRNVLLWTMTDNSTARSFYEREGFFPKDERTSERGGETFQEVRFVRRL